MSESSVQTKILSKLRSIKNSEWTKATVTNKAGTQDIIGQIEGRYIAIEIKTDEFFKGPSALQAYRISRTLAKGGVSFWTNDWHDTLCQLRKFSIQYGFNIIFSDK